MEDPIAAGSGYVTLACSLIVALFAAKRYDTPETNRLSTTQSLFFLSGAGYVAASLLLFWLLSEIVLKPGVLTFLGVEQTKDVIAKFSAPPVLAAVILTTLLPNTVVLSAADAWLLALFQSWGRIPHGVRILADRMTMGMLSVTPADLADLAAWITEDGDIPTELTTRIVADGNAHEPARGKFTRVLRLYHELEKRKPLPDYARAFRARREAWEAIHEDFRVFAAQSQAFFVLFDQLTHVEGPAGQDALKQARDRYNDICQEQWNRLAEFLAQMFLIAESADPQIEAQLKRIGFDIPQTVSHPLPIGPFVFMGVVMILAILGVIAVMPTPPRNQPLPLALNAILIGSTKTIGVLAAVLPKLRWSMFRPDGRGKLPYLAWLASAGVAALASLVIERTALVIALNTTSAAFDFGQYPLTAVAPTTFAISLAIAIICDVDLHLGDGWMRRLTEGMLCGVTMSAAIFLCMHLLDIPAATAGETPYWFPLAFSFSLGFIGGSVAPYLYRNERGEETRTQAIAARAGSPA